MQKKNRKLCSYILSVMLTVAMVFAVTGCNGNTQAESAGGQDQVQIQSEGGVLGEGSREFPFSVVDQEGDETQFEIHTDKETVGDALSELGLIAGDEGEYGLYVKTVNGITADYDKDGAYWAFYVNGEYASSGVDSTPIAEGESYCFRVEKE